ncbi:MAG: succinate dehydrogenase iron-sulfur subunit [Chloroflexi bacterium]|nr:succinate dehydrogenase iron-sulfur subunit [Chloroflexota bacterium]MCI0580522.1 succinate dehydrogenase iron-sulfur subunit [Chloroflexota bacterium]MCI0648127.1 succinate dehydrogenase iron-sulfur subunit [Chloroflexota bacterium]MCI0731635.1 succinate dehydrogenase iron-sulfur subunit [Chloroflexota bacterium]
MHVDIRIRRFNPEKDAKPWWGEYSLDDVNPSDSVLDVLHRVKWSIDGTLALRRSCGLGICGSDAMRINGGNALACKTLVRRLAAAGSDSVKIQVEPMLGLAVLKDLIVDMEPFFDHYRSVLPFFVNDDPLPADGRERLQSPEDRAKFDDTTKCILCAACTTSCPSFWADGRYVGPAAIVQAHRFIFDSRDKATEERLNIMGEQFGVWRCRTIFNCTRACPRDIEVTRAIAEVKVALTTGKV